ncbi:MAG: hypothetical protein R2856_29675 [Caldilineaceae bacterium]
MNPNPQSWLRQEELGSVIPPYCPTYDFPRRSSMTDSVGCQPALARRRADRNEGAAGSAG